MSSDLESDGIHLLLSWREAQLRPGRVVVAASVYMEGCAPALPLWVSVCAHTATGTLLDCAGSRSARPGVGDWLRSVALSWSLPVTVVSPPFMVGSSAPPWSQGGAPSQRRRLIQRKGSPRPCWPLVFRVEVRRSVRTAVVPSRISPVRVDHRCCARGIAAQSGPVGFRVGMRRSERRIDVGNCGWTIGTAGV